MASGRRSPPHEGSVPHCAEEHLKDFAEVTGIELVTIGDATTVAGSRSRREVPAGTGPVRKTASRVETGPESVAFEEDSDDSI
jgi:hypothetical protein